MPFLIHLSNFYLLTLNTEHKRCENKEYRQLIFKRPLCEKVNVLIGFKMTLFDKRILKFF